MKGCRHLIQHISAIVVISAETAAALRAQIGSLQRARSNIS